MDARGHDSESDEDLSFGGWRDWLLVLIGTPIFAAGLYAGARLAVGSKSGGILLSPAGALVVALVAIVVGGVVSRRRRQH